MTATASPAATAPIDKDLILRAVRAERRAFTALVASLDPAQFDTPTLLPGWRVREVVAHVISLDVTAFTFQLLPVAMSSMERLERWNDRQVVKRANRSPQQLLVALDRWGRRFVRLARALPSPLYRTRVPTLWGRGPGGLLIWSRAYDEWVHRQDIRRALGMPDEEVDLAHVVEFVLNAMRANTLPQMAAGERAIVEFPGTPILPWTFDRASNTAGPSVAGEDAPARVVVPAHAFMLAAAGRESFEDLLANGVATIQGDEAAGRAFLSKVHIV